MTKDSRLRTWRTYLLTGGALALLVFAIGRTTGTIVGTGWSLFPPLLAIVLALVTKEVYSSLVAGIVAGGFLCALKVDGVWHICETALMQVLRDGFVARVADPYNIGILFFLVLLGSLVAMMNRTGGSAAFGAWAQAHVRSRVGAQVATILLGILIFVDDYFNCLTVGSVMRPVTDAKRVSRAKLAYLIDSTAAPVCIIVPISSWAAAVAGFTHDAGTTSGFTLFVNAIPYNFYALLTLFTIFFLALSKLEYGPMRWYENAVSAGRPDHGARDPIGVAGVVSTRGRVCDLLVPVLVLIVCCVVGMLHSGGYFGPKSPNLAEAFSASDASVGLVTGSALALVFTIVFYLCRRVLSFRDCMAAFPEGFRAMVPAILILCCSWTLKGVTDTLGAKEFVSGLVKGSAAGFCEFLPATVFVISILLAFATGSSWGAFGLLIPIVLAALPNSPLATLAVAACMAGAVCGDHCSPISDTTIMASAGAQCDHVTHVYTQLPYVLPVAIVSFVVYLLAPFLHTVVGMWVVALALMIGTLLILKWHQRRCGTKCHKSTIHSVEKVAPLPQ